MVSARENSRSPTATGFPCVEIPCTCRTAVPRVRWRKPIKANASMTMRSVHRPRVRGRICLRPTAEPESERVLRHMHTSERAWYSLDRGECDAIAANSDIPERLRTCGSCGRRTTKNTPFWSRQLWQTGCTRSTGGRAFAFAGKAQARCIRWFARYAG